MRDAGAFSRQSMMWFDCVTVDTFGDPLVEFEHPRRRVAFVAERTEIVRDRPATQDQDACTTQWRQCLSDFE